MRQRKLQEEGKTDQARADLARLALIKKQREEAARKREEQKKGMLHKNDLLYGRDLLCAGQNCCILSGYASLWEACGLMVSVLDSELSSMSSSPGRATVLCF